MAKVTFLGAAQEVTGSCHLLESEATGRIILDCGMHQGGDAIKRIQKDNFDFDIQNLDAVILSHAHLDHSGLLPKLVSKGFSGPIFCTSATADLLRIMLTDAAGIYERDLARENLWAVALVVFPGGYGTLDELFETLTLIQTKKMKALPVLLFGREYWERIIDFEALLAEGAIDRSEYEIFQFVETPQEAWQTIRDFYTD